MSVNTIFNGVPTFSFPGTKGITNQVIASNADGTTDWKSIGGVGAVDSVTAGTNLNNTGDDINVVLNLDDDIVIADGSITLTLGDVTAGIKANTLEVNGLYSFPITAGSNGQVLSYNSTSGNLEWTTDGAGTVQSVGGSTNINISGVTSVNPVVELVDDIVIADGSITLTLGSITAPTVNSDDVQAASLTVNSTYTMPNYQGTAHQVLACPTSGSTLIWEDNTTGGVTSLAGTANQISASASTGAVTLSLPSSVSINALTLGTGTPYALPTTDGTTNQVLKTDGSGTVSWATDEAGTVISVSEGTNISVTGTSTEPVVNLADDITIADGSITLTLGSITAPTVNSDDVQAASLTVNSTYTMPTTLGTAHQVLACPVTGTTLLWEDNTSGGVTSLAGTANQISASASTGAVALSFPSSVSINALTLGAGTPYALPTTDGTTNQVLKTNGSGTVSWATDTVGAVSSVTGTANKVTVSPTTGDCIVTLPSAVNLGTGSSFVADYAIFGGTGSQYILPNAVGSNGQTLSILSAVAGTMEWVSTTTPATDSATLNLYFNDTLDSTTNMTMGFMGSRVGTGATTVFSGDGTTVNCSVDTSSLYADVGDLPSGFTPNATNVSSVVSLIPYGLMNITPIYDGTLTDSLATAQTSGTTIGPPVSGVNLTGYTREIADTTYSITSIAGLTYNSTDLDPSNPAQSTLTYQYNTGAYLKLSSTQAIVLGGFTSTSSTAANLYITDIDSNVYQVQLAPPFANPLVFSLAGITPTPFPESQTDVTTIQFLFNVDQSTSMSFTSIYTINQSTGTSIPINMIYDAAAEQLVCTLQTGSLVENQNYRINLVDQPCAYLTT